MSNSLWLLLKCIRPEKKSTKHRATEIRRYRFEQLEPRMMLSAATVNWNDVRQIIDGFGASSAWMWGTIPQTALDQLYSTTSGAGLSLLRSHIYPQGSSSEISVMQQVAPYGVTVWSSPWSPPREWKTNNDNNNGGYLDPAHYQDYATQLANYALNMKALGVPLYAISLQNEPDMNVSYESCLWTEDQFAAFLPIVGATFAARGVTTKIMLPEISHWSFELANSVMANPSLSQYVGILAAHNYDPTYHPYVAVNGTGGLPLWETEVYMGTGVSEIAGALSLASDIHKAFTVGGADAYHYWWLSASDVGGLMTSSWGATKRLWAMGQYSRFVRPGWVMIGETDDGGLDITTFKNPASGEFAIVAVNSGSTDISETFSFNGFTATSVTPYITSGTSGDDLKQYSDITTTAGGSFVGTVAADSIVTYTGISSTAPTIQAPTNLCALPQYQNQTTQIALSWDDNSTTEANYTVERSTNGTSWTVISSTLAANTISYVDSGRAENTLYYYRVKATNGTTSSDYSPVVSCRTILAAPYGVGTWGSNPSGVNLGWNNASSVNTGETIERSTDGLTWTLIATLTTQTTAYSDTIPGYNANQLYCYRIRNTAGNVVSAYASYNTTLKAPSSFTASSIGATQITFTWVNNTSSSSGNWIEQYNSSTSSWSTISPTNLAGSATTYTVTGLTENTSYRFRLRSSAAADLPSWVAGSIWSSYTSEATPTTLFAAPTNLTAIAASSTQTNLVWTDNSAIETNYTVERSTNGTSWTVLSSTLAANTLSYTDNSTPTGTVYYRVKVTTSTASSIYATTQRIAAAPVITAAPSPVTGTSAALSVPALVGFGNGSLTYTWSTIGTPPAPVTFSVNGTSASNSTTATFTKSGAYTFRITVADSTGLSTTNTLTLTVNQTLTTITVAANGGAIVKSTWQQCTATAYDQFGVAMTTQPTFTWSVVSGGGSITSAGLYAAPSSAAAPVVKAASSSVYGLLTLSVLDTAQLKAVYSFNEGSGNTAHDQLGVGVDGILSWGVNYATGRLGDALQFDGSTGSVWMGNPASLDIVGQITLAAWIKPTSSSGIQNIVGHSYGLWPNQAETVLRINAGKYEVGVWNGATTVASYTIPAGDINTWVHLVGTYDGKTWRLYRNGALVATATTSIGSMHVLKA
ncbi:MAG: LamG-like jellyroll fold domain-containing protein, partial [Thermoguttaceae bacterium]